jgi:hypothetical protein
MFQKYRLFFMNVYLSYTKIWNGAATMHILVTRIQTAHRVMYNWTCYCADQSNSLKTGPTRTYPGLIRLKHSAVAFYARMYSRTPHIIQDMFRNTYVILAEIWGLALFQTLCTKRDFINIFYIALFQIFTIQIHMKCDSFLYEKFRMLCNINDREFYSNPTDRKRSLGGDDPLLRFFDVV